MFRKFTSFLRWFLDFRLSRISCVSPVAGDGLWVGLSFLYAPGLLGRRSFRLWDVVLSLPGEYFHRGGDQPVPLELEGSLGSACQQQLPHSDVGHSDLQGGLLGGDVGRLVCHKRTAIYGFT